MPAVSFAPVPPIADVDRAGAQIVQPSRAQGPAGAFAATLAQATNRAPPTRTPLGGEEAASALASAYKSVTGQAPTAKQLSVLVAQWSLETGGGRSMMNNNFGGIKGSSPAGLSTAYTTKEGFGASERTTVARFRAYQTPEEGAKDYLQTLQARFPKSFAAARAGDAAQFAHTLKTEGYYTGSEADYTRAVAHISDRALTQGFASAGQSAGGGGPHPAIDLASGQGAETSDSSMRALDALTMADEMTRAAMSIATGSLGAASKGNS